MFLQLTRECRFAARRDQYGDSELYLLISKKLLFYPQFSAVRRFFFAFNIYKLKRSRNDLTIRSVTCLAIFSRITTFSVSIRSSRQELHHPFTSCCSFVVHHGKLLMISRSPNVQFHQFTNFFPTYSLRTSSSLPASHRPISN